MFILKTSSINKLFDKILFHGLRTDLIRISNRTISSTPCLGNLVNRKTTNLFFQEEVQFLLKKLTRKDLNKVFRHRKLEQKLEPPEYRFMTTEQLEKAFEETEKEGDILLQMPPIVPERNEIDVVLSKDPELTGYENSKFVFTDISFGKSERNRITVVRDEDGTLRKATWEEKNRINQIYFPRPGRQIKIPKMFTDVFLKQVLDRGDYEFVLDRACSQFEPDDPLYHRVTRHTFEHIDENQAYNSLRSTRHYGPMVYFLVTENNIDNLILENLQSDRLEDACWLISLYHIINPTAKSKGLQYSAGNEISFIRNFIEKDSKKSSVLNLALLAYSDGKKLQATSS